MVRRAYTQRSLVEVLLPDGDRLWNPTLRRIDAILENDEFVDRIAEAFGQRHPCSRSRGRLRTPAAVVLRLLVLLHLYDWSFGVDENLNPTFSRMKRFFTGLLTTCALFINEFQAALIQDLKALIERLVPERGGYRHDDPRYSGTASGATPIRI